MSELKYDKPILFNSDMVRALLDGRKTQTRRVIKQQPKDGDHINGCHYSLSGWAFWKNKVCTCSEVKHSYGFEGGYLWVRETWKTRKAFDLDSPNEIKGKAKDAGYLSGDYAPLKYIADDYTTVFGNNDFFDFGGWGKTRVSIHMPRWASRLTLKITDIRVERLQYLSEADAVREGIEVFNEDGNLWYSGWMNGENSWFNDQWKWHCNDPVQAYKELWDSINFKTHPWESNPWVWVIEFEVIKKNIDEVRG